MLIKTMTMEHVEAVAEIERQCFSQPWSQKSLEDSIQLEDTLFLICEDCDAQGKKQVAGYVGAYLCSDIAEITNVAVSPEWRKRGCAMELIRTLQKSPALGTKEKILLDVRISNHPAIALYEKMGFEKIAQRKNFYEHPTEDAYTMQYSLI